MTVVNILRYRNSKRAGSLRDDKTEIMVNKGARLPTKRQGTKHEENVFPFSPKYVSDDGWRRTCWYPLLSSKVVWKCPGKTYLGKSERWSNLNGRSLIPKFKNLSSWQRRGLEGSTVIGKTKWGGDTNTRAKRLRMRKVSIFKISVANAFFELKSNFITIQNLKVGKVKPPGMHWSKDF